MPFRVFWQQFLLSAELAERRCNVLFSPGGTVPLVAAVPRVTMSQNMLPFEPAEGARYGFRPMRLKLLLLTLAQTASFRRAEGLIFLSDYARVNVCGRLGGCKGTTAKVPHGIPDEFRCAPRTQRPISECSADRPFRLLYVSIIDVYKHQVEVVQAVELLRRKGLFVQLHLVGPHYGPALRALESRLARVDPEGQLVQWHGAVAYDDLPEHYRAADLFVYASSCENLPIILLEAMASGLPIVSSSRGPMPEVLGESAGYFDPEDLDSIAAALELYIRSPQLRAESARIAHERASVYTWPDAARKTYEFLARFAKD